ncbi:hypothetical protein EDB19DRAFT_1913553 [Suillus lakei]|nr:hypothetical protein EDB19DRAFT_1913553 [Suillus lakei]
MPMKDSSAMPIIINLKRIKPGLALATDFTNPEEVPQLELSDGNEIIVASGQHCLAALKHYHGGLKDELTALTKKCAKIKELKHPSQEHIESYNVMWLKMSEILGQLEGIGKWGVTVYNEGVGWTKKGLASARALHPLPKYVPLISEQTRTEVWGVPEHVRVE